MVHKDWKHKPQGNAFLGGQKRHGSTSEARTITGLGGELTPASGALEGCKSDGTISGGERREFRLESKATENDSMSMRYDWLCKITQEAISTGRRPVLLMSFVTPAGNERPNGDWAIIPLTAFKELFDAD